MTCAEFQAVLPDILEDTGTAEQRAHLTVCSTCSDLVSDIHVISQQARLLRASDDPNQRVWNSLEIALRQEGLIRDAKAEPYLAASRPFRRWAFAWFLPATVAFLVTLGVLRYEKPVAAPEVAEQAAPAPAVIGSVRQAPQLTSRTIFNCWKWSVRARLPCGLLMRPSYSASTHTFVTPSSPRAPTRATKRRSSTL